MLKKHVSGLIFVSIGMFFRLGAGLLVLIYIARVLGSEEFGKFALWLAVATIFVIPINFGFATAILREFGREEVDKSQLLASVFAAKVMLSLAVWSVALLLFWVMPDGFGAGVFVLIVAQTFESFTELYSLSFRAKGAYRKEATTASVVAALQLALILLAGVYFESAFEFAAVFALTRICGLVLTRLSSASVFGKIRCGSFKAGREIIKNSFPYGLEIFLNTVYTQVDSILIGAVLGLRSVGLYQAGMKMVLGFSRVGPVVAMYILPHLTQLFAARKESAPIIASVLGAFGLLGAILWFLLAQFSQAIELEIFGNSYDGLAELLSVFGALLFVRFIETAFGMVLVAKGLQGKKVIVVTIQLVFLLFVGVPWMIWQGLVGWLFAVILSTVFLLGMYAWLLYSNNSKLN